MVKCACRMRANSAVPAQEQPCGSWKGFGPCWPSKS